VSETVPEAPLDHRNRVVYSEIILLTLVRLVMNTANRMVYPFMPAFSRGMGISTSSGRLLISARSLAGGLSFLFGPASDRFGRKNVMLAALGIFCASMLLVPAAPIFAIVYTVFILIGLAKAIFDPSLQAFVGDSVPYRRRGLGIGIIEMAWSGALLLTIPIIGILIEKFGWKSPFYFLAVLSFLGMIVVALRIPRHTKPEGPSARFNFLHAWQILRQHPVVLSAISFSFAVHVANESIFVVYGEWMEGSFGLKVGTLGLLTTVIGIAELIGEFLVIFLADRLGKKRVAAWGILSASIFYLVFPWLGNSLWLSMSVLFLMFVTWETGIVAAISLITEQLPEARGTLMASNVTGISLGRVVGALAGGWLWGWAGFAANGLFACALNVFSVFVLLRNVKD